MYEYHVRKWHRVVDGDTYDIEIDLGFYQFGVYRIRLLGYDTPEIYGRYATEQGPEARDYVLGWVTEHGDHNVAARTRKADSFGRWLATIVCQDCNSDLGKSLYEAGHAIVYND